MVTSRQWGAVLLLGHDSPRWLANRELNIARSIKRHLHELSDYHTKKYAPVIQISAFARGTLICMLKLDQKRLEKLSIHRSACLTVVSG